MSTELNPNATSAAEPTRSDELVAAFRAHFSDDPILVSVGPGRVNLIGEHTDYNGGFVLPIALKRDVRMAVRPRKDRRGGRGYGE